MELSVFFLLRSSRSQHFLSLYVGDLTRSLGFIGNEHGGVQTCGLAPLQISWLEVRTSPQKPVGVSQVPGLGTARDRF